MNDTRFEIVGWEKFQHYKDRTPKWIKNYLDLLRRDEYTDLTPAARAVLHGVWLLAASRPDANRMRARSLSSDLKMRVTSAHIDALNQAGFIRILASETVPELPKSASPELETEKEEPREGAKVVPIRGERPPAVEGFTLIGELVPDVLEQWRRGAA